MYKYCLSINPCVPNEVRIAGSHICRSRLSKPNVHVDDILHARGEIFLSEEGAAFLTWDH